MSGPWVEANAFELIKGLQSLYMANGGHTCYTKGDERSWEVARAALQACSLVRKDTAVPFRRRCRGLAKRVVARSRAWCGVAECKIA